jgi:hypothetical protein
MRILMTVQNPLLCPSVLDDNVKGASCSTSLFIQDEPFSAAFGQREERNCVICAKHEEDKD